MHLPPIAVRGQGHRHRLQRPACVPAPHAGAAGRSDGGWPGAGAPGAGHVAAAKIKGAARPGGVGAGAQQAAAVGHRLGAQLPHCAHVHDAASRQLLHH